jgi:predicted acetyltransferase
MDPGPVTFEYGTAAIEEHARVSDVLAHAFAVPSGDVAPWLELARHENVGVLRRDGRVAAALIEIPMGQYFGGRAVPMIGVAGVGVAPELRGSGVGRALMTAMLERARARGFAISCLYPATHTLYRRVGYEIAGSRFAISYDPRQQVLPRADGVDVVETRGIPDEARALYTRMARHVPGALERGHYIWARLEQPRGFPGAKAFVFTRNGKLSGYASFAHTGSITSSTQIVVFDHCAESAETASAMLRLYGEYRSLASSVKWYGPSADVFTHVLPERYFDVRVDGSFMIRIVDVEKAFAARGWRRDVSGAITFELEDASLAANAGVYRVAIEDGRAVVARAAGSARARLGERALAALYAGFHSARTLRMLGELDADDETVDVLDAWLSGPIATMREHF